MTIIKLIKQCINLGIPTIFIKLSYFSHKSNFQQIIYLRRIKDKYTKWEIMCSLSDVPTNILQEARFLFARNFIRMHYNLYKRKNKKKYITIPFI